MCMSVIFYQWFFLGLVNGLLLPHFLILYNYKRKKKQHFPHYVLFYECGWVEMVYWFILFSYLHFGIDTVRDLVSELIGSGVRLGQQEWIRQRAILGLHDL